MEQKLEDEVFEKKKPLDKKKLVQKIFALTVIIMMLFSVCGTLLFYLIRG